MKLHSLIASCSLFLGAVLLCCTGALLYNTDFRVCYPGCPIRYPPALTLVVLVQPSDRAIQPNKGE